SPSRPYVKCALNSASQEANMLSVEVGCTEVGVVMAVRASGLAHEYDVLAVRRELRGAANGDTFSVLAIPIADPDFRPEWRAFVLRVGLESCPEQPLAIQRPVQHRLARFWKGIQLSHVAVDYL